MRKLQHQVMTANRLSDGAVVYLDARERWVENIAAALVSKTRTTLDSLLARAEMAVRERRIVGPYPFAVESTSTGIQPISKREHIRSLGPTVGTDLRDAQTGA